MGALLLYSKRLFPSFTQDMVREKVADFAKAVARTEPEVLPRKRRMFREIWKTVEEFCPQGQEMVADYQQPFPPSVSACYEYSRGEGGLQAYVRDFPLQGWLEDPTVRRVLDIWRLTESDLSDPSVMGDLWRGMLRTLILEAVGEMGLPEEAWRSILVGATGLTEPLKVRIVTKAEWFVQLLVPIQKAWHGKMRIHPVFQLIGGASVEDALNGLMTGKGEKVVSGDYSAATDNIFLTYTAYAAEAMLSRTKFLLPEGVPEYTEHFLRKLAIHSLTHAMLDLKGSSDVRITRGQMMGHILSFPLLCIINRAASCMAIPRSRFMRINGDDVIFPATKKEYAQWKSATRAVGLEFSLGKNYYSSTLALVNSVYCTFSKQERRWRQLTVPNVGLLNMPIDRQVDMGNGRQILPWEQLAQLFREFTAFAGSGEHQKYLNMFRKYYPILRGFPGPFYGPVEYGALGAPVPSPKHKFTSNQLMWMNAHRLGLFDYREGTRNDYSKICSRYEAHISLETGGMYRWGPTDMGGAIGPPRQLYLLGAEGMRRVDPYASDGGLGFRAMAMRRWFQDLSSNKHVKIFGARRWNQFKLSRAHLGGVPPLPANYLHKVLENSTWSLRPAWHRSRDMIGVRYEDDASFLHEIFQAPQEEAEK
jgi:hypothetical protein